MPIIENQRLSPGASELCFLADRAADARAAIARSAGDMKDTLTDIAGVSSCTARHPWIVTGSMVAVGVVVGALLTPAKHNRIQRRREKASLSTSEKSQPIRGQDASRAPKSALLSIAGTVLAAVLSPLVQSWFAPAATDTSQSAGKPSSSGDSESENIAEI